MTNIKIDLVIPYVDNTDVNWQLEFNKYKNTVQENDQTTANIRFRGMGTFFKYLFRGIAKNMPWINNVFLVVSSESQVPAWLDKTKIKIVTHEQFIPKKHLPLFNSSAIEMYLPFIPRLSEYFLYTNDDIFTLKPLMPDNFFKDGKCLFNLSHNYVLDQTSRSLLECTFVNNNELLFYQDKPKLYYLLGHEIRPFIKSKLLDCYNKHKIKIEQSITKFRDTINYNCYLYALYLNLINLNEKSFIKNGYMEDFKNYCLPDCDVICINDTDQDVNIYEDNKLNAAFNNIFANKSIFEL